MQPTHNLSADRSASPCVRATLRHAARYLRRYGWIQGSYYDQTSTAFTPAACTVGAIGMVCYGGPVEAPAQMFDEPGFDEFEAAVAFLDQVLHQRHGQDVYTWNDDRARTPAEVLSVLETIGASPEPGPYQAAAQTLHRLADGLASLAEPGLPEQVHISVHVQPPSMTPTTIATVDTIGSALCGAPGVTARMPNGSYHHTSDWQDGPIRIAVYAEVPDPAISTVDGER